MKHTRLLLASLLLLFSFGVCSQPAVAQTAVKPPPDTKASLRSAKTIYVASSTMLVGQAVIESKLRKRPEFQQYGLVITRNLPDADLVLEVSHDLFTMFVYTATDPRTNVVVASGKLSSLGGTVAGKVAKRFMKEMVRARS